MGQPFIVQVKTLHSIHLEPGDADPSAEIELVSEATGRSIKVMVRAPAGELQAAYRWVLGRLEG
jgi:hypothetical protein